MFKRVMLRLDKVLGRISNFLILVSGLLILLMAWAQTYGVVKRYAFHAPDPIAYELSTMCLLFCGVLAVAGVERLDLNVKNDLISSRFSLRIKLIVTGAILPFLALIFCAVLTWKSLDNALYALKIGQVTQSPWALPLAPIKIIIPLCYILLCLVLMNKIYHNISLLKDSKNRNQENGSDTEDYID